MTIETQLEAVFGKKTGGLGSHFLGGVSMSVLH